MATAADRLSQVWAVPAGFVGAMSAVNHRSIGKRYIVTAIVFFILGGLQALMIRLQLAQPGLSILSPDAYNQFFTMHGTTMMFLFAVPVMEGLGIYVVPLMIGARDMAFPRLNAFGYWVYLIAGVTLYWGFFTGSAPDSGWFNYPPLTGPGYRSGIGIDYWVTAITFLEIAALVAAVELIVTILMLRAPGMSISRIPLFVWSITVMSFMIIFAMPPLMLASVLLALDRMVGTHFFNVAAGGQPLLWQHLFWVFGHPEVYIILLPALGIISAIIPVAVGRPIVTYTLMVMSLVAIGFLSFGLWVHHMFATGLPILGMSFFAAASMMITIPSGIQLFSWMATVMRGRRLMLHTPMLFAIGFLVHFIIGGITGVMVASVPFDLQVHDTHFVVAHFHYVLIGGVVLPLFAGLHFWFPKMTGRMLSERLGKASFWAMIVGFNLTFFLMHLTGLLGMPRRVYTYLPGLGWGWLNLVSTIGAFVIALGVLIFLWNVLQSLWFGRPAPNDPWGGATLEWATSSPPPQYNFATVPIVRSRDPLWEQADLTPTRPEFARGQDDLRDTTAGLRETILTTVHAAVPYAKTLLPGGTLWPLWLGLAVGITFIGAMVHLVLVPLGALLAYIAILGWTWPTEEERARTTNPPPDSGELPFFVSGPRSTGWWGIVLLIVIESTVFASLIVSYFYLKVDAAEWPLGGFDPPDLLLPSINAVILLVSAVPMIVAERGIRHGNQQRLRWGMLASIVLAVIFMVLKVVEYSDKPYDWSTNAYGSIVWTITGFHSAHVIAVLLKTSAIFVLARQGYFTAERRVAVQGNALYWYFVVGAWVPLFATLYLSPRLL